MVKYGELHVIYEVMSPVHECTIRRHCSASWREILTDVVKLISVCKIYSFGITLTCRHAGETVMYSSTLMLPLAGVVVNTSHCALFLAVLVSDPRTHQ